MPTRIAGFEWDEGNREKCTKHGVSRDEIEALFTHDPAVYPDPAHSDEEIRYRAIGRVNDRYVFVVFTLRTRSGHRFIRPISARYMHAKEVRHYEQQTNPQAPSGSEERRRR